MPKGIMPNKNHKIFLSELCNLIKDYSKIKNFRDKNEVLAMLEVRIPLILNNFDKNSQEYEAVAVLLFDVFENLGTIVKFIKDSE